MIIYLSDLTTSLTSNMNLSKVPQLSYHTFFSFLILTIITNVCYLYDIFIIFYSIYLWRSKKMIVFLKDCHQDLHTNSKIILIFHQHFHKAISLFLLGFFAIQATVSLANIIIFRATYAQLSFINIFNVVLLTVKLSSLKLSVLRNNKKSMDQTPFEINKAFYLGINHRKFGAILLETEREPCA